LGLRLGHAREAAARWHLAAGAAAGMMLGYVLLPDWAPLTPERHWHWLAYLAAAAAVLGATVAGRYTAAWERLLAMTVLSLAAALTLVLTWDTLEPPRRVLIPLLATYLTLIYALLAALAAKRRERNFAFILAISAFATAGLVGYEVSMKFGQLGVAFAAALSGAGLWTLLRRRKVEDEQSTGDRTEAGFSDGARALGAIYAFAFGGLAFVAAIEPTPPATPLLLAPAAPLALWLFVVGPLSKIKPLFAVALQTPVVISIVAAIAIWLYLRSAADSDEWSHKATAESRHVS